MDTRELITQLRQARRDAAQWDDRTELNNRIRYCKWNGQSEDGRKWAKNLGKQPFPFEGASDTRIRIADEICNEQSQILKTSFNGAKLKVAGTEVNDISRAGKATTLMNWMLRTKMRQNIYRELNHITDWRGHNGLTFLHVCWDQEFSYEEKEIGIEEIIILSQEMPELEALPEMIADEESDEESADILALIVPETKKRSLKRMVKELRTQGVTTYQQEYLQKNLPSWRALRTYEDIYFPPNTRDIQEAEWIAVREWMTEAELEAKALQLDWSDEFVKACKEKKGTHTYELSQRYEYYKHDAQSYYWDQDNNENLIEIFYFYHKTSDKGVNCICTEAVNLYIDDNIRSKPQEILPYKHGKYPFVQFIREDTEPEILQSRGIPEILTTWQNEIKVQRDYQCDRASMDILPPARVPASRGDLPLYFGPAAKVPERRPGEIQFFDIPSNYNGSEFVIQHIEKDINSYFGRPDPTNPQGALVYRQNLVNDFLVEIHEAVAQTFALCQQYLSPMDVSMVLGGQADSFSVTREEIQGNYDFQLQFDARDLDSELQAKKLELISNFVLPTDTTGATDRALMTKRAWELVDPFLAEELVRPQETVTQVEIEEEQSAVAQISAGVEPPFKQGGNAQLRLDVIQNSIQSNPQLVERYQKDEIFKGMIDARIASFNMELQQMQNAQIGRFGSQPFLQNQ